MVGLAFGNPTPQPVPDAWTGLDKWQHFTASAVIQSVGYGAALGAHGHGASLRIGAASVVVFGLGREIYDWRVKGRFSKKDLVWNALGAGAAMIALTAVR